MEELCPSVWEQNHQGKLIIGFASILTKTLARGGTLLIPSFAVERAKEVISDLVQLMAEGELPAIPIHVDSPLAKKATEVFTRHSQELEGGSELLAVAAGALH